ncbi:hypothetical protein REPUB_Repub08aG0207500 [Reevesia pubescens]
MFKVVLNLCREPRIADEALLVLKKMPEFNFRVDTTVYNVVVRLFCEKGDVNMADKLMKEMGLIDLYPDMITNVAMIKGFCNVGRLEDACVLFQVMTGNGCFPNVVAYSALLEGIWALCEGHVEEAYKLIDKVVNGGGVSDGDCFSSLVVSLIRINRLDEAEKLFRKMLASGAKPDSIACSIMIREICRDSRVLDNFCLYDEIEHMRYLPSIDSDIYSILLVGLCQGCHSVEAAKLAKSMLVKKIFLKAPYVEKIVGHLKNCGDKELVNQLGRIGR